MFEYTLFRLQIYNFLSKKRPRNSIITQIEAKLFIFSAKRAPLEDKLLTLRSELFFLDILDQWFFAPSCNTTITIRE